MAVSAVGRLVYLLAAVSIEIQEHANSHRRLLQLVEPTDRRDACSPFQKSKSKLLLG